MLERTHKAVCLPAARARFNKSQISHTRQTPPANHPRRSQPEKIRHTLPEEPGLGVLLPAGCRQRAGAARCPLPRSAFGALPPASGAPPSSVGAGQQGKTQILISVALDQQEGVSTRETPDSASLVIQAALRQQGAAGALAFADAHAAVQLHVDVPKFQLAGLVAAAGRDRNTAQELRAAELSALQQHLALPIAPSQATEQPMLPTDTRFS